MKYTVRLKNSNDFHKLYRRGKTFVHPLLVLYLRPNGMKYSRVGVVSSKKLGCAVYRNRVRRRLREVYRRHEDCFLPGYDILLVGRGRTHDADFQDLEKALVYAADQLIRRKSAR